MRTLTTLLLLFPLATACASGPSKYELDAEVKRLCAIDGGIKVYETVKLLPDQFDKWGMVKLYSEQRKEIRESRRNDKNQMVKEFALGDAYIYKSEDYYYHQGRRGGATMVRYHHQVIRRSDGKLLGETISYGRGGGDLAGPWEPSSFHCPPTSESSEIALFKKIFLPMNRE